MKMKNLIVGASLALTALSLTGCGGGGSSTSYGYYNSPYITATGFVNSLNDVDGAPLYDESEIVLYTDETYRSTVPGEEDWFVIYDAKYDEYKAVSLQYIRAITYYSYYSSNYQTAEEFREIENDDIFAGYLNGDAYGDDYEVVDLAIDGYFYGRESGFAYEDEAETTDVNLMAGDAQMRQLAQKVSNISYAYQVSPETALSLASLGKKVKGMVNKGADQGELTEEDQAVLLRDLEHLTGVSLEEVVAAGNDPQAKDQILSKIANKTGTNVQSLENKILPELFGVQ